MKQQKIILTLILCLLAFDILAQQRSNNYFEIERQADEYYKQAGKKNTGYKQYRRWQWYMSTRTELNGDLANTEKYKQEALVRTNWMRPEAVDANTGSWSFLGPTTVGSSDDGIGRADRIAFHPTDPNILYVASAGGGLWKTTNGGSSWSSLTNGLPNLNTSGIVVDYNDPNILYLLTGDGDAVFGGSWKQFGYVKYTTGVLKSTDGGVTWYQTGLRFLETDEVRAFKIIQHPTSPNILFVASDAGIFRTTDGGASWSQVWPSAVWDIEFRPGTPSTMYAVGNNYFFRSNNTGVNWSFTSYIAGTGERMAIAVCPSSTTKVYVLAGPAIANTPGTFRGFFRFNNTDSSMTEVTTTPNILGREPDGSDTVDQARYDLCLAVRPDNSNTVLSGGIYLWRTTNGGSSFSWVDDNMTTPASEYHSDIHDLAYNPLDNKLYMCGDGGVYVSTDHGVTFSVINTNLAITQYYKISSSKTNADLILGGAQDNGTSKRFGSSSSYIKVRGADGMDCAFGNSSNSIHFASAQDGDIARSGNSGSSFTTVATPAIVGPALGHSQTFYKGQWCTPIALHPSDDNIIFIGYDHLIKATRNATFGVYSYEDLGEDARTFVKVGQSNTNRIYVAFNDDYYNTASNRYNTVKRSDDGGGSWTTIRSQQRNSWPPVTDLAINPGNSLEVWLTYGGFVGNTKVFYSSDGGANWTNVTGSLPNVPINCVIYGDDANNTNDPVYIGTDIGVFYKDNTLGDWIPFSNGLPSVEVTDLEMNVADNLLRAGTYGRGMWETSLYSGCVANLTLTAANQSVNTAYYHQVSNKITSSANAWGTGSYVFYKAGVEMDLVDGFWAAALDSASTFNAAIGPCGGGVPNRPAAPVQIVEKSGYLVGPMMQPKKNRLKKFR